jgi:hypothetical protein
LRIFTAAAERGRGREGGREKGEREKTESEKRERERRERVYSGTIRKLLQPTDFRP